jgi:precorrin-4 methylase
MHHFGNGSEPDGKALAALASVPSTLVLYMSLAKTDILSTMLNRYYPSGMPLAVVFYAGYPQREKVLRTTVGDFSNAMRGCDRSWLGLVIVGEVVR